MRENEIQILSARRPTQKVVARRQAIAEIGGTVIADVDAWAGGENCTDETPQLVVAPRSTSLTDASELASCVNERSRCGRNRTARRYPRTRIRISRSAIHNSPRRGMTARATGVKEMGTGQIDALQIGVRRNVDNV